MGTDVKLKPKSRKSKKQYKEMRKAELNERITILMEKKKYKEALFQLNELSSFKNLKPWTHVTCITKITECLLHLTKTSSGVLYRQQKAQVFDMLYKVINIKPKLVLKIANDISEIGKRSLQAVMLYDCAAHLFIKKGTKKRAWQGALLCLNCFRDITKHLVSLRATLFARKLVKIILYEMPCILEELVRVRGSGRYFQKYQQELQDVIKTTKVMVFQTSQQSFSIITGDAESDSLPSTISKKGQETDRSKDTVFLPLHHRNLRISSV